MSSTTQPPVDTTEIEAATTSTTVPPSLSADGWLLGVELPTKVSDVIAELGEPDTFELPDLEQDLSPWGQWFRWTVSDDDFTYSVLGDDYSDQVPDYDANVEVAVLRRDADVVSPALIDGVMLGLTTRAEIEASFGSAVQVSGLAERRQFDSTGIYASSLVREQDGLFTFYLFDDTGLLVGIAQATYDLGNVD